MIDSDLLGGRIVPNATRAFWDHRLSSRLPSSIVYWITALDESWPESSGDLTTNVVVPGRNIFEVISCDVRAIGCGVVAYF